VGIGGHMLGEKKLRRLSEVSGLSLDRAYRRGRECEGRVVAGGRCIHYEIDWDTGENKVITTTHWSSCPKEQT